MLGSDDLPAALARLLAVGKTPDVAIRPVLLRVVVDLFVNKHHHAPDEVRQFETIVSHLLDHAELETRAIVAERLASHPSTPPSLIQRFLADEAPVAASVYAGAVLDEAAVLAAATWGPAELAAAVARRKRLGGGVVAALAARPEDDIVRTLAGNAAVPLDRPVFQQLVRRARHDGRLAALLIQRPADPIDYAPLFPLAGTEQRRAIIEAALRLELGKRQWGRLDGATAERLAHLDHLILSGERESFEAALGLALGINPAVMEGLLQDEGGEILALALAAAGSSAEMATRAFILGDPRIGRSVDRVHALTAIVATVSPHAARRLITAMAGSPGEAMLRRTQATKPSLSRRADAPADAAPVRREVPVPSTRRLG